MYDPEKRHLGNSTGYCGEKDNFIGKCYNECSNHIEHK